MSQSKGKPVKTEENDVQENYIRRERQKKEETEKAIKEMRASLKICTIDDIREHKMPYSEALFIGLQEKGYQSTAAYIQQLIDFQTEMTEKAGSASFLWTKPQLKDNKVLLKLISDSLSKAEDYHKEKHLTKECETFLKLAAHIAFLNLDWWWLGEQLLIQCIDITTEYFSVGEKYEALSRYAYAKFLVENFKETEAAEKQLTIVRDLSNGTKWTPTSIFPDEKGLLFAKTNYLLYVCLIQETKYNMRHNWDKAIRLAAAARKRAAEACYLDGETKALLLKGICEMSANLHTSAIASFTKAYYIQERLGSLEGICETRLQLAQAYLMNGDTLLSLKSLLAAKEWAEKNNLSYYVAQAYKYLGEFYLNSGEPRRATPFLGEALKILHVTGHIKESEQVRNLEAVSTGLELFPKYVKLLSNVSHPKTGLESLMKMVNWKDSREQFWTQDDDSDEATPQVSDTGERDITEEPVLPTTEGVEGTETNENDMVELHFHQSSFNQDSIPNLAADDNVSASQKNYQINNEKVETVSTTQRTEAIDTDDK